MTTRPTAPKEQDKLTGDTPLWVKQKYKKGV